MHFERGKKKSGENEGARERPETIDIVLPEGSEPTQLIGQNAR